MINEEKDSIAPHGSWYVAREERNGITCIYECEGVVTDPIDLILRICHDLKVSFDRLFSFLFLSCQFHDAHLMSIRKHLVSFWLNDVMDQKHQNERVNDVVSLSSCESSFKTDLPKRGMARSLAEDSIISIPGRSFCVGSINKPEYWQNLDGLFQHAIFRFDSLIFPISGRGPK